MAAPKKDEVTVEETAKPQVGPSARPNDIPIVDPMVPNSTLADRQAARAKREQANKRVASDQTDTK